MVPERSATIHSLVERLSLSSALEVEHMDGFSMALGLSAGFHLVLADGHNQLQGQSKHVAKEVVEIFAEM